MKIVIVDDESSARSLFKKMLNHIFNKNNTPLQLWEAHCLKDAVEVIKNESPDIVLLDIEMPEHSGLEILDFFKGEPITFQIIFATAYNRYAIDAFKLNAIDYLLKPIDIVELEKAIEKAKSKSLYMIQNKLDDLRKTFSELKASKIVLEIPSGLMFVDPNDIIALVADGNYTTVYVKNETKTTIAKPLKHFTRQLEGYSFFYKPHRSYYINLKFLKEFSKKEGNVITLENGMSIPLSREKKDEFLYLINEIF